MHLTLFQVSTLFLLQQQIPLKKSKESALGGKASKVVFIGDTKMGKTESMTLGIQLIEENKAVLR